jgi:bacterioferritin (cytochrome b1)
VADRAAAITSVQGSIASEASTRAAAITGVQNSVTAEASTRATADTSLSNRITTLENVSSSTRLTELESDVADHESRISALETVIDGGTY